MRSGEQRPVRSEGRVPDPSRTAAQWSMLVGRLADTLTHEIRNPLNGAMVNLQVVSSRAGRAGQDAAALEPFAASAASELERAAALVESMLAVLRPPGDDQDVVTALKTLVTLYAAVARRAGGSLALDTGRAVDSRTTSPPELVRLALAAALEASTAGGGSASASVERAPIGGGVAARVRCQAGVGAIAPELAALLNEAGIGTERSADEYVLYFPALAAGDA